MVAIADTNADPDLLAVPIAGNDDAIRSVSLISKEIADTVQAALAEVPAELLAAAAEEEEEVFTYSSDAAVAVTERGAGRRSRRRRRPRPEVIAAHRGTGEGGGELEGEPSEGGESAEVGEDAEETPS